MLTGKPGGLGTPSPTRPLLAEPPVSVLRGQPAVVPSPALTLRRPARGCGPGQSSLKHLAVWAAARHVLGPSPQLWQKHLAKTWGFGLCSLQEPSSQCPRAQTPLPDAGQLLPGQGGRVSATCRAGAPEPPGLWSQPAVRAGLVSLERRQGQEDQLGFSVPTQPSLSRAKSRWPCRMGREVVKVSHSTGAEVARLEGGAGRQHLPSGSTWPPRVQELPQAECQQPQE